MLHNTILDYLTIRKLDTYGGTPYLKVRLVKELSGSVSDSAGSHEDWRPSLCDDGIKARSNDMMVDKRLMAVLGESSVYIFDEPTSNLDSLNEAVVLQSLVREREGKTIGGRL